MSSTPRTTKPLRFFLHHTSVLPGRPWSVMDDSVGRVAQTDDGMTLAYFADRQTAREFMWKRNRQHFAGACPEYIEWWSPQYGADAALSLYLVRRDSEASRRAVADVLRQAGYPAAC
ncbi:MULTISPECIES: hypothetical protein [unclassified Streptomyces]|uniref:hypothetical protein n=1 Tax=unclassified Streptomyces TaxID=2593676 RepID=UPI00331D3944